MAENVGGTARAMLNCGLTDLILVKPRENHLSDKAVAMSSGAKVVLENAKVFETFEEAISDFNYVLATTARRRDMIKEIYTPDEAAKKTFGNLSQNLKCAIVFGKERTGLENEHVALSNAIIEIPLNPNYCSLNLAQAVLVVGYEWFKASHNSEKAFLNLGNTELAEKADLLNFFSHLEKELDNCGHLRVAEKRERMVRNIRNMFIKANLTKQEVQTLHGIVKELVTYRESQG